jgi:hypothetical protein
MEVKDIEYVGKSTPQPLAQHPVEKGRRKVRKTGRRLMVISAFLYHLFVCSNLWPFKVGIAHSPLVTSLIHSIRILIPCPINLLYNTLYLPVEFVFLQVPVLL